MLTRMAKPSFHLSRALIWLGNRLVGGIGDRYRKCIRLILHTGRQIRYLVNGLVSQSISLAELVRPSSPVFFFHIFFDPQQALATLEATLSSSASAPTIWYRRLSRPLSGEQTPCPHPHGFQHTPFCTLAAALEAYSDPWIIYSLCLGLAFPAELKTRQSDAERALNNRSV